MIVHKKYLTTICLFIFAYFNTLYSQPFKRYVLIEFYQDSTFTIIDNAVHKTKLYAKGKGPESSSEFLNNMFVLSQKEFSDTLILKIDEHEFELSLKEVAEAAIIKVYLIPDNASDVACIYFNSQPFIQPEGKNFHRININSYSKTNGELKTRNSVFDRNIYLSDVLDNAKPIPFRPEITEPDIYTVDEIQSDGNYYVIYVHNEMRRFKIISRKTGVCSKKIKLHKSYSLKLNHAIFSQSCLVNCTYFDKTKSFCEDSDAGLFVADNLNGLCYEKLKKIVPISHND